MIRSAEMLLRRGVRSEHNDLHIGCMQPNHTQVGGDATFGEVTADLKHLTRRYIAAYYLVPKHDWPERSFWHKIFPGVLRRECFSQARVVLQLMSAITEAV